jgi:hypothetical protein
VPSCQLESLQQQSAASTPESTQDKLKAELGLQFYALADTQARKEYGENEHSFAPPSPGNQGNPLETMESPAAHAQESQESIASSPSTPGGLNVGHALRKEWRKDWDRTD